MAKYLEYEKETGRILSIITLGEGATLPAETDSVGYFEIPDELSIDTGNTLVRDGKLVRATETVEERRERERLAREAKDRAKRQYKGRLWQFLMALAHAYDRETSTFSSTTELEAAQDAIFELDKWL